jgi:hypothetical protein
MALAGALCTTLLAVTGITNRSLRARVAGLLGTDYSSAQMSYDLRRLRMKGVITGLPGTNSYTLHPRRHAHRRVLHPSTPRRRNELPPWTWSPVWVNPPCPRGGGRWIIRC